MAGRRPGVARGRFAAGAADDFAGRRRHRDLPAPDRLRELRRRDPSRRDHPGGEAVGLREDLGAGRRIRRPGAGTAAAGGAAAAEPAGADDLRRRNRAQRQRGDRRHERPRRGGGRTEWAAAGDVRRGQPRQGAAGQGDQAAHGHRAQPRRGARAPAAPAQVLREQGHAGRLPDRERLAGVLMPPDVAFLTTFLNRHPVARRLILPAAGVLAFFVFLVLTFPYDLLARRIEMEARRAGADVTIGSAGAGGLASVRARDVRVRLSSAGGGDSPELRFERALVSPDILALILRRTSFGFSLEGY